MSRQNDIWEYLRGRRTGRQANRFEQEVLSDPFLYEAVEGLMTVEADHEKIVRQLRKQMSKRKGNGTVRLYRWIAAASFLLLAGIVVVLVSKTPLMRQEAVVAGGDRSDTTVRMDLQLMAAQVKEKDTSDIAGLPVRKITGKMVEKKQIFYRRAEAVEDMAPVSGKAGSTDVLPEAAVTVAANKADRQEVGVGIIKPADLSREGSVAGYAEILPKAENKKKDKKRKTDIADAGTKSVASDSLMPEKTVREGRRTRVAHTKNRGIGERKFRQEVALDHAEWIKSFDRYVADSLRYPEDARLKRLEGEVRLAVRLNRKGLPARIRLLQRLAPSCNREAIRLVEEYPGKWENTEKEILLTIPFKFSATE